MSIRVLLSSKYTVVCEGIASVLYSQNDFELVGMTDNPLLTNGLCDTLTPDVVVIGMQAKDANDLSLVHDIARLQPEKKMVAFCCTDADRHSIIEILAAGAIGYVSTTSSMDEMMQAIRAADVGRSYLCQSAAEMMDSVRHPHLSDAASKGHLGDREEQVLCLIADGLSSKEIARNLFIAPSTVEVHRRNIMRKIGLHKVADLTRYAIRNQMVAA